MSSIGQSLRDAIQSKLEWERKANQAESELDRLRAELEKVRAENLRFQKENDVLRGIAAKIMPCHYCGVDSIGKCPSGFPGCALADDLTCAEECANKEVRKLTTALDSERAANAGLRCEVLSLKADIETAILAMRNSYDATEWPADGTSGCEIAAKALEERLNSAPTTETKGGK